MNEVIEAVEVVEAVADVKALNVYERLNEIKKAVKYIQKDKKVESYMAVTHDAVTALTHDHFVQWGVMVEPHELTCATVPTTMMTKSGIPYIRFEAKYRVDFVNINRPDERASIELTTHALDHGDKSPGKGLSYATKAATLKILQLESGETEADEARPQDVKIAKEKDKITSAAGALERLEQPRRDYVERQASSIIDCFEANTTDKALECYEEITDMDERVACWSYLDSKMRRTLKTLSAEKEQKAHRGSGNTNHP